MESSWVRHEKMLLRSMNGDGARHLLPSINFASCCCEFGLHIRTHLQFLERLEKVQVLKLAVCQINFLAKTNMKIYCLLSKVHCSWLWHRQEPRKGKIVQNTASSQPEGKITRQVASQPESERLGEAGRRHHVKKVDACQMETWRTVQCTWVIRWTL